MARNMLAYSQSRIYLWYGICKYKATVRYMYNKGYVRIQPWDILMVINVLAFSQSRSFCLQMAFHVVTLIREARRNAKLKEIFMVRSMFTGSYRI